MYNKLRLAICVVLLSILILSAPVCADVWGSHCWKIGYIFPEMYPVNCTCETPKCTMCVLKTVVVWEVQATCPKPKLCPGQTINSQCVQQFYYSDGKWISCKEFNIAIEPCPGPHFP